MTEQSVNSLDGPMSEPSGSDKTHSVGTAVSQRENLISQLLSASVPSPTEGYGFASVDSRYCVGIFNSEVSSQTKTEIAQFTNANGGYCLDIGCGYMTVGRKIAQELGLSYVGVDIINHGGHMTPANMTQETQPGRQESFHQLDIFSAIHNIGDAQLPCVLLNNFDPSTYLVSGKDKSEVFLIENKIEEDFLIQLTRVLKKGGYIIAFGTTVQELQGNTSFGSPESTQVGSLYETIFYQDRNILILKKR